MTQLPVQSETVDMRTGEVIKTETALFTVMPAPAGACPECGTKHDAAQPHNASSLHYQYTFYARHHRWPTWVDALAHCDEQTRAAWKAELIHRGVDVDGGKLRPEAGAS